MTRYTRNNHVAFAWLTTDAGRYYNVLSSRVIRAAVLEAVNGIQPPAAAYELPRTVDDFNDQYDGYDVYQRIEELKESVDADWEHSLPPSVRAMAIMRSIKGSDRHNWEREVRKYLLQPRHATSYQREHLSQVAQVLNLTPQQTGRLKQHVRDEAPKDMFFDILEHIYIHEVDGMHLHVDDIPYGDELDEASAYGKFLERQRMNVLKRSLAYGNLFTLQNDLEQIRRYNRTIELLP